MVKKDYTKSYIISLANIFGDLRNAKQHGYKIPKSKKHKRLIKKLWIRG